MKTVFFRIVLGVVSLVLVACTSAPMHYYTIVAPAIAPAKSDATAAAFVIEVLPVGIPAQVDQPQLVVRQGEGGVAMVDGERWAAPLSDELHAALSIEMAQRLGTQNITGLTRPVDKPMLRVKLEVRRFDSVPGQYVLIDADWSLGVADDQNNARLLCHSRLYEPVRQGYADLVRGHQRAIATLATQMADAARDWVPSHRHVCPFESAQR